MSETTASLNLARVAYARRDLATPLDTHSFPSLAFHSLLPTDRVAFLRRAEGEDWPDVSDATLAAAAQDWLATFIEGRTSLAAIQPDDLDTALRALLPWDMQRRLDAEAPTHFEAPTGSHIAAPQSKAKTIWLLRSASYSLA